MGTGVMNLSLINNERRFPVDNCNDSNRCMNCKDIDELRKFGLLVGGITAGALGMLIPIFMRGDINLWFWGVGGCIIVTALGRPAALRPFYSVWMRAGHLLGWINTRIILGVFFFCILLPAGLLMRAMGKDPMKKKFDPDAETYRIPAGIPARDHFERPF